MNARGFSLIELLVACAVVLVIGGALAAMIAPLRAMVDRSLASADLEGGRRAVLEMLAADLREAGADPAVSPVDVRLARAVPPLMFTADLDAGSSVLPAGALWITAAPHRGAQAVLRSPAAAGDQVLLIDTAARCPGGPPSCGFASEMPAHLLGIDAAEAVTVALAGHGFVTLRQPLTFAFPPGSILTAVSTVGYGTRPDGQGALRLVRRTAGGAEQPMIDHVVAFSIDADSLDARRVRRVVVTMRLEAPSAALRGPAGILFRRGGSAPGPRWWLPDVETRLSIALRSPLDRS